LLEDPVSPTPPDTFDVSLDVHDSVTVMRLSGEFDLAGKDQFDRAVEQLPEKPGEVLLDLRGLEFIDSTGLRSIVELWHRSQAAGYALAVVAVPEPVGRLFKLTGLDEILPVVDDAAFSADGDGVAASNGAGPETSVTQAEL
jgi:anti-sigma B factor antagonist